MPNDESKPQQSGMTMANFLYELTIKHLPRAVFLLLLFTTVIVSCVWFLVLYARPQVEVSEAGSVTVHATFGPEEHLQLVSPFGWQSTDIYLKTGQQFDTSAAGKVTVGYAEFLWSYLSWRDTGKCIRVDDRHGLLVPDCFPAVFSKPPFHPKWSWVGPEGYPPEMYKAVSYAGTGFLNPPNMEPNKGMLGSGIPHGSLISYVSPEGRILFPEEIVPRDDVLTLGVKSTQHARRDGILWIAVNDSVGYFDDNLGYFVLTVTKH